MPLLRFPADRIVGVVDWNGSWADERGPVLATGSILVPDDVEVSLQIEPLRGSEPQGGGAWRMNPSHEAVDVAFLRDLPSDAIDSLSVRSADEVTFDAVAHLASGLRRLCLGWTGFTDAVLPTVAQLVGLSYLQTFGNNFTDRGVQQLAALVNLESLYLEEETLSSAAFDFLAQLPRLRRLGLQDVPLSQRDIEQLRSRLPAVEIGDVVAERREERQ